VKGNVEMVGNHAEDCLCHEKINSSVARHECDIKDKLNSGVFYWLFGILVSVLIIVFGASAYQLNELSAVVSSTKETIAVISSNQQGVLYRQTEMAKMHNNSLEIQARLGVTIENITDRLVILEANERGHQ